MGYSLRRGDKYEDVLTLEEQHVRKALRKAGFQGYDAEVDAVTLQDFTPTSVLYHHYRTYWANLSHWAKMEMVEEDCLVRALNPREFGVAVHRVFPHLDEGKPGQYRARHRVSGSQVWGYLGIRGPDSVTVQKATPPHRWKNPKYDTRRMNWKTDPVLGQMLAAVANQHEPDDPQAVKESTAYAEYRRLLDDESDQSQRLDSGLPELRPMKYGPLMARFRPFAGLPKVDRRTTRAQGTAEQREAVREAFKQGLRGRAFVDFAGRTAGLSQARAYALVKDLRSTTDAT